MPFLETIAQSRRPLIKLANLLVWSWSFYAFGFIARLLGWPASDKQMHILSILCIVWSVISLLLVAKQRKVLK